MAATPSETSSDWLRNLEYENELKSAVDGIFQTYPNFRILILGRSGVGKSNLINAIFKTSFAIVEHGRKAGVSNIETEIKSPQNPRLILHDSQGFSHGSGENFNIVKNFIMKRSREPDLKDRLHAIWLCSTVPTYGGSLLEIGEEEILQMKDCTVPIVVVFTKYDVLVESLKPEVEEDFCGGDLEEDIANLGDGVDDGMDSDTGASVTPVDPEVLLLAKNKFREMINPFETMLEGYPRVKVSVRPELSDTLDELQDVTGQRINSSLGILWASTQQQSVAPKIEASINVGKQKYWRGLSTTFKLSSDGKSLEKWFKVVHKDIVTIWGVHDPKNVLSAAAKVVSELQQDLVEVGRGSAISDVGIGAISAGVARLVTEIDPHAAIIAFPIAAGFTVGLMFAKWIHQVVSVTPNILRGMMGYIVDLTIVMQSLFFLMQARKEAGSPFVVDEALFKVALEAYIQDTEHSIQKVHDEIRNFASITKAIFKPKVVIKEVERLINDHRFKPSERFVEQARAETTDL